MTDAAPALAAPPGAQQPGWPAGAVQAASREIARQTAARARAVAEFAASRPAAADRPAGAPGAMRADRRAARPEVLGDVSEWAAQELVLMLSITQAAAENLLERSLTLVHRLPRTLVALERGVIHDGHLWHLLDKVAPITDPVIRARVEREVLDWVAARSVTTPPQLAGKVRRTVLRLDAAAAAQRLARALRERGVFARAERREGMAVFEALLTVPEVEALLDALGRYADALDDPQDGRTRGQKMADCLLDLVLRPGEHGHAPVRAELTVIAGVATLLGGDQPGEIGGEPVPAEMVRALARALGLLPDGTTPAADVPADVTVEDAASAPDAAPRTGDASSDGASAGHREPPADDRRPTDDPGPTDDPRPTDDSFSTEDPHPTDDWFPPDGSPEAAALEAWWARVEERALRGEWGGEEDPPLDELERWWAEGARYDEGLPPPASDGPPATGRWADADRAVEQAGTALLDLQRATDRAVRAVDAAARADAGDEDARQNSSSGRISRSRGALDALREATTEQRDTLAALLDRGAGSGLVDRPRIAVVDELTGSLLCLTDSDELRALATCGARACRRDPGRCDHDLAGRPGLGPPRASGGYRPSARLDRFVRARDRRCRFPGCRRRVPRGGELDHDRPWPDGPTSAANLVGYCTGHHRGKHQAPGWRHHLAADGTLTVTTPTGLVASTTPPPF